MRRLLPFALCSCLALLAAPVAAQTAAARDAMVVSAGWLADHLHDPNLVLFHVGVAGEYPAAHIPGARLVSTADLSAPRARQTDGSPAPGLALEMPDPEAMRAKLQSLGVSDDSKIVVYFAKDWLSPATRIVFALDWAGLGANTVMLDGGMPAWTAAGHPTTGEVPAARTGRLKPIRPRPVIVDAAFVQAVARTPHTALVDARTGVFYDGVEPSGDGGEKGHIAGAGSVPFTAVFDDAGALKPAAELEAIFSRAGVQPGDTVVGYCHIGQQATAMLFAARSIGHPVRLYDGSMDDWLKRKLPLELPKGGGGR
ncbi:MAG: rhodanese-like domain-containing protein [Vicinamibacterales bacterium]